MWRKLRRKWWFWVGLNLLMFGLITIASLYYDWHTVRSRGEERRDEAVRRLDAIDPNWRAEDLCAVRNAALPPRDQNAAERALEAVQLLPSTYKEWSRGPDWRSKLEPGVLPHHEDLCEFALIYQQCGPALEKARTVRLLEQGGFPLIFAEPDPFGTLLHNTQDLREAASARRRYIDCSR